MPNDRDTDHTTAYFDTYTPEYWHGRHQYAVEVITRLAQTDASLVDVGCGIGNTLEYVRQETGLRNLCGLDASRRCAEQARERTGCRILVGSILDDSFVASAETQFDFALLAAVLHHLVGSTRSQSKAMATHAIANALRLVRPGGYLIVIEPVFYPQYMMDLVFYIKRAVCAVTSNRLELFGVDNNLGAPVVSYYTTEIVKDMICAAGTGELIDTDIASSPVSLLFRLANIRRREEATLVVRRTGRDERQSAPRP